MRSWGDDQLRQELVKAVATLAGIPAADVNWFVCVVVFSATTMAQRFTIAVCGSCWAVPMSASSEPLSTHMDSLVLFQMHQELSSKYGLYMSDDDMYADNSSINYIIANRLVRVPVAAFMCSCLSCR